MKLTTEARLLALFNKIGERNNSIRGIGSIANSEPLKQCMTKIGQDIELYLSACYKALDMERELKPNIAAIAGACNKPEPRRAGSVGGSL